MSRKTIEISDTKAIRVEAVEIKGEKYVSIRQMYRRKGETEWNHAKQGINIPLDGAAGVLKYATKFATSDSTTFSKVEIGKAAD
jgi:hypothetical protein